MVQANLKYPPASWDMSICAASIISIFAILCQRLISKLNKNYNNRVRYLISVAAGNTIGNSLAILLPQYTSNYYVSSSEDAGDEVLNNSNLLRALAFMVGILFPYIVDLLHQKNGKQVITTDIHVEHASSEQNSSHVSVSITQTSEVSSDTLSVNTGTTDLRTQSADTGSAAIVVHPLSETNNDQDTSIQIHSTDLRTDPISVCNISTLESIVQDEEQTVSCVSIPVSQNVVSQHDNTESISLPTHSVHNNNSTVETNHPQLGKSKKKKRKRLEDDYLNLSSSSIPLMLTIANMEGCAISGAVLGSAFAKGRWKGSTTTFVMFCLGATREFSETAVVMNCGATFRSMVISSSLNSVIFWVGTTIGITTDVAEYVLFWMLPFASGLMMYIGLVKLLPLVNELIKHENTVKSTVLSVGGFLFGSVSTILMSYTGDKIAALLFL